MVDIVLAQRRYVETRSGSVVYKIELSASKGETTISDMDPHVFVITIGDTEDSFHRVATIADLDLITTFRETAVAADSTLYRTSNTTLSFTDLDTAIAAIPVVRDRINNLVSVYTKARRDFITPSINADFPSTFDLPLNSEILSVKESLIADYVATRDLRISAETEQTASQSIYDISLLDWQCKSQLDVTHCGYSTNFSEIRGLLASAEQSLISSLTGLEAAARAGAPSTHLGSIGEAVTGTSNSGEVTIIEISVAQNNDLGGVTTGELLAVKDSAGLSEIRVVLAAASINNGADISINLFPRLTSAPVNDASLVLERYSVEGLYGAPLPGGLAAYAAQAKGHLEAFKAGMKAKVIEFDDASSTECTTALTNTNTAWGVAQGSLGTLQEKQASSVVAQTNETTTTASLAAYCPTLDLDTIP